VFEVEPSLVSEFTGEITARIWSKLEMVLRRHGREDVFGLSCDVRSAHTPGLVGRR
jgi:hypothetical protein